MSPVAASAVALVVLCLVFAGVHRFARRIDNYGIVDVAWSYAFGPLAVFLAWTLPGWGPRRVLVAGLVVAWSLRLGTHLARRVAAHHPREDGRYARLRRDWGAGFASRMVWFFQLQALSVLWLALPLLLAANNPAPGLHPVEMAGIALWLTALVGEGIADAQLAAFKRDPARRGSVCTVGLWRWSRHPNYFFEWLVWGAFALLAWPAPGGWLGLLAPLTMLYLLLRVTGIPLTEEQAVRSKGEAYRRYQQTTSRFVPWPPRRVALSSTH